MIRCQTCKAPATLFICERHIQMLDEMLGELPWLIAQLEVTRCRQDRLTAGSTRRSADTLSPINVGAMELAREADRTIVRLDGRTARQIAHDEDAGEVYDEVVDLVGDPDHPDTKPGAILAVINRAEKVFAGLCPTLVGRDHEGRAIECATPLYGTSWMRTTECPRCHYEIDVARNRSRCAVERDLMTEAVLLDTLETLGEKVSRNRFLEWVSNGRIKVAGYIHQGILVPNRIQRRDSRVFSLSAVRALRLDLLQLR